MELIKITVVGTSPLLQHNPAGMARGDDASAKKKTIPTPEAEAEAGCYRDDQGNLFLPTPAFRSALVGAAKGRRLGKTAATTIVKGATFAATERTTLIDPIGGKPLTDYDIDTRRAVVQRQAVLRSRPRLENWQAVVELEYDEEFIVESTLVELMEIAGRIIGVGDYRPEKSGPFGRFDVKGHE